MNINWYPGHMLKTKKQIIDDLKLIDVVIELLDARIPVSSKNPDIQQYIENKKRIVVLNKSDLAEEKETIEWVKYYKKNNITAIIANSNLGKGIKEILKQINAVMEEDIEKASVKGRIKRNIRVMIVRNTKCRKILFNK